MSITKGENHLAAYCPAIARFIFVIFSAWISVAPIRSCGSTNGVPVAASSAMYPWFRLHPLTATKSKGTFQWTSDDCKDTNIIRQIAHNDREYRRMILENHTIYRRQLVYFKNSFASLFENATQAHQSTGTITLPGLDGQTYAVDVTRTDIKDSGMRGRIYGKLQGDPDSLVTVAFANEREAFTIISPKNQIYLQAEPREPGEVIVKSVNPKTYGVPGN